MAKKRRKRAHLQNTRFLPLTRLEGYSDAVFSIAATIGVLPLEPPEDVNDDEANIHPIKELLHAMWNGGFVRELFIFFVSFMLITTFWRLQSHLLSQMKHVDSLFVVLNASLLLGITVCTYSLGLLIEYPSSDLSTVIFACLIIFLSLVLSLCIYYPYKAGLFKPHIQAALRNNPYFFRLWLGRRLLPIPTSLFVMLTSVKFKSDGLVVYFLMPLFSAVVSHFMKREAIRNPSVRCLIGSDKQYKGGDDGYLGDRDRAASRAARSGHYAESVRSRHPVVVAVPETAPLLNNAAPYSDWDKTVGSDDGGSDGGGGGGGGELNGDADIRDISTAEVVADTEDASASNVMADAIISVDGGDVTSGVDSDTVREQEAALMSTNEFDTYGDVVHANVDAGGDAGAYSNANAGTAGTTGTHSVNGGTDSGGSGSAQARTTPTRVLGAAVATTVDTIHTVHGTVQTAVASTASGAAQALGTAATGTVQALGTAQRAVRNKGRSYIKAKKDFIQKKSVSLERVCMYSDGVFAIVATLLAVDLQAPSKDDVTSDELTHYLSGHVSLYIQFFVSFVVTSQAWTLHHMLTHHLHSASAAIVSINSILLWNVAMFPYFSQLLGSNVKNYFATWLFTLDVWMVGIFMLLIWRLARKPYDKDGTVHAQPGLTELHTNVLTFKLLLLPATSVLVGLHAFFDPAFATMWYVLAPVADMAYGMYRRHTEKPNMRLIKNVNRVGYVWVTLSPAIAVVMMIMAALRDD